MRPTRHARARRVPVRRSHLVARQAAQPRSCAIALDSCWRLSRGDSQRILTALRVFAFSVGRAKVVSYCELKERKDGKDVSRLRSVLLELKHKPQLAA